MMLPAQRATRALASREWIRASFGPQVFAGLGLGAMTRAEAISILGGAQSQTATAAEKAAAYDAYYGPAGFYTLSPSVVQARAEAESRENLSVQRASPLYAVRSCSPMDTACVAASSAAAAANQVIMDNDRRDYYKRECLHQAQANGYDPGESCGYEYMQQLPLPPVPSSEGVPAARTGAAAPLTPEQRQAQADYRSQYTPQGTPQGTPQVPNQTVPPRPQAGEVPAGGGGGGTGGGGAGGAPAGSGLPFGLTANTLLIGGAVLAAILLLKGKG